MANWITTHWPHPIPDDHPWHIYLKSEDYGKGRRVTVDDVVFFYQTGSFTLDGKDVGSIRRIGNEMVPLEPGAKAIVGLAKAIAPVEPIPTGAIRYDYGDGGHWTHWVRCSPLKRASDRGRVRYQEMLSILGRGPRTPAYVFGLYEVKDSAAAKKLSEHVLRYLD